MTQYEKFREGLFSYVLQWTKFNIWKKLYCFFVDVSECVVLLSKHKTEVKEDIIL